MRVEGRVQLREPHEPNFLSLGRGEVFEFYGNVDAGLEGFIERFNTIGCEEEDSVVVFENAEQHC